MHELSEVRFTRFLPFVELSTILVSDACKTFTVEKHAQETCMSKALFTHTPICRRTCRT